MVLTPTMKFFLVATHFIPYFLIPLMLWSVNHRKEKFYARTRMKNEENVGIVTINRPKIKKSLKKNGIFHHENHGFLAIYY